MARIGNRQSRAIDLGNLVRAVFERPLGYSIERQFANARAVYQGQLHLMREGDARSRPSRLPLPAHNRTASARADHWNFPILSRGLRGSRFGCLLIGRSAHSPVQSSFDRSCPAPASNRARRSLGVIVLINPHAPLGRHAWRYHFKQVELGCHLEQRAGIGCLCMQSLDICNHLADRYSTIAASWDWMRARSSARDGVSTRRKPSPFRWHET